jgi:hypothetical protein
MDTVGRTWSADAESFLGLAVWQFSVRLVVASPHIISESYMCMLWFGWVL